jgi:hypothetical protein
MPIERDDIRRAILLLVSLGAFLGALMLSLYLRQFWFILLGFAALLIPLFVAGFRGSNKESMYRSAESRQRRPRFAVGPATATIAFIIPGIAAVIAGVYLLIVGEEVIAAPLLFLAAPLAFLAWWGLRS